MSGINFVLPRVEQKILFVLSGMFPRVYVACLTSVVDALGRAEPSADTQAHPSCASPDILTFTIPTTRCVTIGVSFVW